MRPHRRGTALLGILAAVAAAAASAPAAARSSRAPSAVRSFQYSVLPGDTLWHIARRYKVSVEQLRGWNSGLGARELRPGTKLRIDSSVPRRGMRKRCVALLAGQSLWTLSRKLRVTVRDLRRYNGVRNPRALRPGQLLCYYLQLPEHESRVVGLPQDGTLAHGEQMQSGPGFHVKEPHDAYGSNALLTLAYSCINEVNATKFRQRGSILIVGDLSHPRGGPIPQHRSHQNGTDIDFGYYYKDGIEVPLDRFIRRADGIDVARTWKLVSCLIDSGEVQYVFMDRLAQEKLYRYALSTRRHSAADLDLMFEHGPRRTRRGRKTIILHVPNHLDHFHVRTFCPPTDSARKGGRPCLQSGRRRDIAE